MRGPQFLISLSKTYTIWCNLNCAFCCQILQDVNTSSPSYYYKWVKKLLSSIEIRLQSTLKKILKTSLAISACSLPQKILPLYIFDHELRIEHLILKCSISIRDKSISTQISIDKGASEWAFISDPFSQTHHLSITLLSNSILLETFDGQLGISETMTDSTILDIFIGIH